MNCSHLNLFVKLSRQLKYFRLFNCANIPIPLTQRCKRYEKLSDTTSTSFAYTKYGLRAGTKTIRYSVNIELHNKKSERNKISFRK